MNQPEHQPENASRGKEFFIFECILLVLVNAIIISNAFSKGGWAALGLLAIVSPIVNGVFAVVAIIKSIATAKHSSGSGMYSSLAILLPVVIAIISLLILFSDVIGGNGC